MESTKRVFARNLELMLRHMNWSESDLSAVTGISSQAIGMYLKQDVAPGIDAVQMIADAFYCQPWEMLYQHLDVEKADGERFRRLSAAFFLTPAVESQHPYS